MSIKYFPIGNTDMPRALIYNTEHIFGLELPEKLPVTLSPNEHIDFKWVTLEEAKKTVFSWTNVKALEKLYDIKLLAS